MQTEESVAILFQLLKELQIPVTKRTIVHELNKHPNPTSIWGMSELLSEWNVPNGGFNLSFEQLMQKSVPTPFVAFLTSDRFAVVKRITPDKVLLGNYKNVSREVTLDEFKKRYGGSVLIAEKAAESGETFYKKNRQKEIIDSLRIPLLCLASLATLLVALSVESLTLKSFNINEQLIILIKTTGLAVATMLLIQSVGAANPLVKKLCTIGKSNCNAILHSNAAKLTDWLSWSEIGFFYFAGTWLAVLVAGNNQILLRNLSIFNLLCLPYTFFSIYYQWQVAKEWCIFCCSIQFLLWLEFFAFLPFLDITHIAVDVKIMGLLFVCMAIPILGWIFLKPFLLKAQQINRLKEQLGNFKYNVDNFRTIVEREPHYQLLKDEDTIVIGNPEAKNTITLVSNPFCFSCELVHKVVEDWLEKGADFKLQIVFSTSKDDKARINLVSQHFIGLKMQSNNEEFVARALSDWYNHRYKSYMEWSKKYPVIDDERALGVLKRQKSWCEWTGFVATPTILLNGRLLPESYSIEDIKYLMQ